MIYRGVSRVSAVNSHKTYWIVGVDPLGRNEDFLFFHPCGCGSQSDIRACDVELRAVAAELEQLDVQLGTTNQSRLAQISCFKCGVCGASLQRSTRFRDINSHTILFPTPASKA
jgi:hypothetical protein